jgi:hypothetical protein
MPHARGRARAASFRTHVQTCATRLWGRGSRPARMGWQERRGGRIRMVSRVMVGEGTCRADHERGVGLLTDSPRRAR